MRPSNTRWALLACLSAAGHGLGADVAWAQSSPVRTPPSPTALARARVLHLPSGEARSNTPLSIKVSVATAWGDAELLVRYRSIGGPSTYTEIPLARSSTEGHFAEIPAAAVHEPGIEYYIVGRLSDGGELLHFASADTPHRVLVTPSVDNRWMVAERERLGGRVSSVSLWIQQVSFHNRSDLTDRYRRGEVTWDHRLLGHLYAISIGYGYIEGKTPITMDDALMSRSQGARYGYGGATLRLLPWLWVDSRLVLGVGSDGLIVGGRGVVTLGRPWAASVDVGFEHIDEMGPSAWLRLQWDSVPGFLMGAAVVRTDLPGAELTDGGALIYDVRYQLNARMSAMALISLGARQGSVRLGGGVGAALAF